MTGQMKAAEQYFPVYLYSLVINFEIVDEILKCEQYSESCLAILSCGAVP